MSRARYHFDQYYGDVSIDVGGTYLLFQTGDINCNPGHGVGEHLQRVHEISYVVSGWGWMWFNEQKIAVQPGMCIINTTGERHRIESAPDEHLRYFYLGFEFLDSAQNESAKVLRSFYENPPVRVVDDAFGIADAFVDLFNEILYQDSISNAMMESCMHRIIGGTYRLATHQHMRPYLFEHGDGENRNFVYDVIHYIDTHAHESALLSQLSTEFGYSYDYIARKFTHITGEKLRDYYHARRFEKARELLREGMSVTAVAERLGYESIHAFSNAFKKRVGLSPSDYRNQTVLKETEENDKKRG